MHSFQPDKSGVVHHFLVRISRNREQALKEGILI